MIKKALIIVVGRKGAGKSSITNLLAERMGLKVVKPFKVDSTEEEFTTIDRESFEQIPPSDIVFKDGDICVTVDQLFHGDFLITTPSNAAAVKEKCGRTFHIVEFCIYTDKQLRRERSEDKAAFDKIDDQEGLIYSEYERSHDYQILIYNNWGIDYALDVMESYARIVMKYRLQELAKAAEVSDSPESQSESGEDSLNKEDSSPDPGSVEPEADGTDKSSEDADSNLEVEEIPLKREDNTSDSPEPDDLSGDTPDDASSNESDPFGLDDDLEEDPLKGEDNVSGSPEPNDFSNDLPDDVPDDASSNDPFGLDDDPEEFPLKGKDEEDASDSAEPDDLTHEDTISDSADPFSLDDDDLDDDQPPVEDTDDSPDFFDDPLDDESADGLPLQGPSFDLDEDDFEWPRHSSDNEDASFGLDDDVPADVASESEDPDPAPDEELPVPEEEHTSSEVHLNPDSNSAGTSDELDEDDLAWFNEDDGFVNVLV